MRAGSTITPDRDLARVFSHKPITVSTSVTDENGCRRIEHDGTADGFLYTIAEPVDGRDVYQHPNSSMEPGEEWLTTRDLCLELVSRTSVRDDERLTDARRSELMREHGGEEVA